MALSSSSTFDVADQATVSESLSVTVEPPVGLGTGGRGRLVHPTLGTYDYPNTPTETVNLDGDVCFPPIFASSRTFGGNVHAQWDGFAGDVVVVERWVNGETGGPIAHLRALWQMYANPPEPGDAVIWTPNYATSKSFRVLIVGVRSGGGEYTIDRYLAGKGFAPSPVELELRVLGDA